MAFKNDFVSELIGRAAKDGTHDFDLTNIIVSYGKTFIDYVIGGAVGTLKRTGSLARAGKVLFHTTSPVSAIKQSLSGKFTSDPVVAEAIAKGSVSKEDLKKASSESGVPESTLRSMAEANGVTVGESSKPNGEDAGTPAS